MDRIVEQNARHHTIAAPHVARARASSHYLKYGNKKMRQSKDEDEEKDKEVDEAEEKTEEEIEAPCPEGDQECEQAKEAVEEIEGTRMNDYYKNLSLGIIDGFVSAFNQNCHAGLSSTIISFFDVIDNLAVYNPTKTAEFQLASVNFTEATNQVYAYCDTNSLTQQFSFLADYNNYENYIVFASRIFGTTINTYPEMMTCIRDGQEKGNGFDIGYCGSTLTSTILDTQL